MGGWVAGWPGGEELEIRLSSGQRKLELGLGQSLAIIIMISQATLNHSISMSTLTAWRAVAALQSQVTGTVTLF